MSLKFDHVKKCYRDGIFKKNIVLKDITYELEKGQVLAVIGQNGAGKSTLIKCLLNFIYPDEGTVTMDGNSVRELVYLGEVGYMPEAFVGPEMVSVRQYIEDLLILRGKNPDEYQERLDELTELFYMKKHMKKTFSRCSKGTVKKAVFIQAILCRPSLLILDEPTDGLDPVSRRIMLNEIRRIKEEGGTVVITTHLLSDLSFVADQVIVLQKGKIAAQTECSRLDCSLDDWYLNVLMEKGGIEEL